MIQFKSSLIHYFHKLEKEKFTAVVNQVIIKKLQRKYQIKYQLVDKYPIENMNIH